MIKIEVLSEEKNWLKKIKKIEFFFKAICKNFPKKYLFLNKKFSLTLLLSNNKRKNNKELYLGDIVISYDFMNKPKNQNLSLFKEKAIKTFIHGFLHLLGFDHIKLKDYKKMLKEEQKIYQSVIKKIN